MTDRSELYAVLDAGLICHLAFVANGAAKPQASYVIGAPTSAPSSPASHLAPGSWDYAREPSKQELAKTAVLALDLAEAAVKIRTGPPGDDEEDLTPERNGLAWAGVLPLHQTWGEPLPCPELPSGVDVPGHVTARPAPFRDGRDQDSGRA